MVWTSDLRICNNGVESNGRSSASCKEAGSEHKVHAADPKQMDPPAYTAVADLDLDIIVLHRLALEVDHLEVGPGSFPRERHRGLDGTSSPHHFLGSSMAYPLKDMVALVV